MRKLLIKLFIKDYKNTKDAKVRTRYGSLAGIVGILSNIVLCTLKIILGLITGAVSILADGINNLADAGSSIVTLIGFRLAAQEEDKDHPFGHERIEYITGVIISLIIILIGLSLGKSSIEKIINPTEINISIWIIVALVISIIIKLWQYVFYKKMGEAISSDTLKATSKDSLNDTLSTIVILIGMGLFMLFDIQLDGYLGVGVAVFILISGIKLLKETTLPLIGEAPTQELVNDIAATVISYPEIIGVHDLVVHSYGPSKIFATIHAEVDASQNFMEIHDIIDNIELYFRNEKGIDLVIHMDPIDTKNEVTNELKRQITIILKGISEELSLHDFRVVHGNTHTNVLFDINMPHTFRLTKRQLREEVINCTKKYDDKLNLIIQIDQVYNRNEE